MLRIQSGPVNRSTIQSWRGPRLEATKFKAQPLQDPGEPLKQNLHQPGHLRSLPIPYASPHARTYRSSKPVDDTSGFFLHRSRPAGTTKPDDHHSGTRPPKRRLVHNEEEERPVAPLPLGPLRPADHPPVRSTHQRLRRRQSAAGSLRHRHLCHIELEDRRTAWPLEVFNILNMIPDASAARPIKPPRASISRTI